MEKVINLLDINKPLRPVVENLIEQNKANTDNIVVLDDNIILYITSIKTEIENTGSINRGKRRFGSSNLKNYRTKEEVRFMVFTKDGLLFGEEVSLVAQMLNKNGDLAGYMFVLADIKEKPNNQSDSEIEKRQLNEGIIFYINEDILNSLESRDELLDIDELYFTGNDIDDEVIHDSLCEIYENTELFNFGTSYIMNYIGTRYRFSSDLFVLNSKKRIFSNIGKFIPMN